MLNLPRDTAGEQQLFAKVAVDACLRINPDNPLAVAESIGEMYDALKNITVIVALTEWPVEERIKWIELIVNKIFATMGIKNAIRTLSEEYSPRLAATLDELQIPIKDGDNIRSMADILNDLSHKWQGLKENEP